MGIHANDINQNLNNTNFNIEPLPCCIVTTSSQNLPRTFSEKLNEDKETGAFWIDVLNRFSVSATAQELVITLGHIEYWTKST